jgi:hypothetical protein
MVHIAVNHNWILVNGGGERPLPDTLLTAEKPSINRGSNKGGGLALKIWGRGFDKQKALD